MFKSYQKRNHDVTPIYSTRNHDVTPIHGAGVGFGVGLAVVGLDVVELDVAGASTPQTDESDASVT